MGVVGKSRERCVVASALWAALGDALGWITELGDEETIRRRTGRKRVSSPVSWKRKIGGRMGPVVLLPAGAYSDDTQLRLAVSRAIRGDGRFDVEAFAKIELPVWPSYSLGAGRGTSSAASNLSRNNVNWFSNFFGSKNESGYFQAGGNGAAMRIQPHVWKHDSSNTEKYAVDVLKDAIVTHGHPQGFGGALFHAYCLSFALDEGQIPSPKDWRYFLEKLNYIPAIANDDRQLKTFWLGPWQEATGKELKIAVAEQVAEVGRRLDSLPDLDGALPRDFEFIVETFGGFNSTTRGAGLYSAINAAALCWCCRDLPIEEALIVAANTIGSDTDTIATMAGAILGAVRPEELPTWELQDRDYVEKEAIRLAQIGAGKLCPSFNYPDLQAWKAPANQSDAVAKWNSSFVVLGLGKAEPFGEIWTAGDAEWQWLKLEFGQTVLAKRRARARQATVNDLPQERPVRQKAYDTNQPELFVGKDIYNREQEGDRSGGQARMSARSSEQPSLNLDDLTNWVISRNFTPEVVGKAFLQVAESRNPIENSIALAAILAKAIKSRRDRGRT